MSVRDEHIEFVDGEHSPDDTNLTQDSSIGLSRRCLGLYPVIVRVSLHIQGSIEVHAAKQLGTDPDGHPAVPSLINLILAPELPGWRGLLTGVTETLS